LFLFAVLALSLVWGASQDPDQAIPQGAPIQIYATTDDNALPVGTMASGENAKPMAETHGPGGVKWYLVKTRSGVVGWIKRTESVQAKKVESFFKSLPREAAATAITIPNISSTAVPRGAIMVPVLSTGRSTIVSVTLNRSINANLMLDTGATNTIVSRRLAALLSLRPMANATVHTVGGVIGVAIARLQSLRVGEAEVTDLPVVIHDFSPDPRFEGLLGMDFLGRYQIGLDVQKQILVLSPK
jgi:hypothetical protein